MRKGIDDRREPVQWDHYQYESGHVEAKDPNIQIYWNTNQQVLFKAEIRKVIKKFIKAQSSLEYWQIVYLTHPIFNNPNGLFRG